MDFETSSKFVSSLAKFLQSLCNGYVEFESGVEVIGHLYINVDTGKKIDYILNEKVCKTDENSVTFVSNSFHAQPAEKSKEVAKKNSELGEAEKLPQEATQDEIIIMEEPESSNLGSLPPHQHSRSRPPKRLQNQVLSSENSRPSKMSRRVFNNHSASQNLLTSKTENSQPHPVGPVYSATKGVVEPSGKGVSHISSPHLHSQVVNEATETLQLQAERDIKFTSQIDSDVTFVKQEYDVSPEEGAELDHVEYDDSHMSGYSDTQYNQYYGEYSNSVQDFNQMGEGTSQGNFYQAGADMSTEGNPDESLGRPWRPVDWCPVPGCDYRWNTHSQFRNHWRMIHEEIVPVYPCSACSYFSRRRNDVIRHHTRVHPHVDDLNLCVGEKIYQKNPKWMNPHPLTFAAVVTDLLGMKKGSELTTEEQSE